MTSMQGDIVNRVKRLPKPSLAAEALQPVFEAVSNSLHAIEDAFGDALYQTKGVITVTIRNARSPDDIEIIVDDNGIGLEPPRFRAFCTTDTDYKMERGGKGVGRLLWLDAFDRIKVVSIYKDDDVFADFRKEVVKAVAFAGIEAGSGFVHNDELRRAQQCLRDAEALSHTAGV